MRFDPARIFQILDDYGVDYLTIGGWAVVAHGYVRATVDIDFVADQERGNIERLARALASMGARLRGIDADKLDIDLTDPDVLGNGASSRWKRTSGQWTSSMMCQVQSPMRKCEIEALRPQLPEFASESSGLTI